MLDNTVCPTRYRTQHFFNNSNTNEVIATQFDQEYVRCVRNEEESSLNEEPLHSEKNGVWSGMSRRRIIGPIFFDATITTAAYVEIFNTFLNQLDDEELNSIFPAGWSDIPHFTRQHGRNSVLFRRPRHFEGTLATARPI